MWVVLVVVFETDVPLRPAALAPARPEQEGQTPLADGGLTDSESISFDESAEKLEKTDRPRERERFRSLCVLERNLLEKVFEWTETQNKICKI